MCYHYGGTQFHMIFNIHACRGKRRKKTRGGKKKVSGSFCVWLDSPVLLAHSGTFYFQTSYLNLLISGGACLYS